MELTLLLNFLWFVPLVAWFATKNKTQIMKSSIRAASFGLVVSPASLGLYGFYFLGPLSAIFGMIGLVLTLIHGAVGYEVAVALNLIPSHTVVTSTEKLFIELINILFWGFTYGIFGLLLGYFKEKAIS